MLPSRSARSVLAFSSLLALPTTALAQLNPNESIVSVATSATAGELFVVDHNAGTSTMLTISAALRAARVNCVYMFNPVSGVVGTVVDPADIYAISLAGGVVTETKLNTTPAAGGNVAQIVPFGGALWFTTQAPGATGGILQSMPAAGGPITSHLDITAVPATGLANALCALGGKIYIATFDSGTVNPPGDLIEYDPAGPSSVVVNLPKSKHQTAATTIFNPGIVNMFPHPAKANTVALQGVQGDYLEIDVVARAVTRHDFTGFGTFPFPTASNLVNAFHFDPRFGDWIVGSRDGHIERWVDGHSAERIISLGGAAFSINGVWHLPGVKGDDDPLGGGCIGNGGYTPTDVSNSLPVAGNAGFAFALHSGAGGDTAFLLLGVTPQPVPVPLSVIGMTPNCFLRVDNIVTGIPVVMSGVGNGLGKASVPLALPAAAAGVNLIHQWAEVQVTKTNTLGIVVSNARRLKIQ